MKVNVERVMVQQQPARRFAKGVLGVCCKLAVCAITVSAQAQDLNAMLGSKYCFSCHAWDKKLVGPAYSSVRARYSASDVPQLVAKVLNGGSGSWGPIPMPSNRSMVSQAEAQFMVAGILGVPGGMPLPSAPPYSPPPPAATGGSTRSFGGGG